MARPTKWRRIEKIPAVSYFSPSKKENHCMPENILKLEELESIRLKDLEGLEQGECAERMGVSRPTFQRILLSAREKLADSLVNGKAINIDGGNYTQNICPVKCLDCGKEWTESFENLNSIKDGNYICPDCGSSNIACDHSCRRNHMHGACRRRGRSSR